MASNLPIKYHPEARSEVLSTVRWYLSKSAIVAQSFFEELRIAERQVQENPETWGVYEQECRIYRLRRFPYGVVYQQRENYILILAVAHLHRKPGYWKHRVPS